MDILNGIKAEAAYFGESDGCRAWYVVVDIASASMVPVVAEPFFQ